MVLSFLPGFDHFLLIVASLGENCKRVVAGQGSTYLNETPGLRAPDGRFFFFVNKEKEAKRKTFCTPYGPSPSVHTPIEKFHFEEVPRARNIVPRPKIFRVLYDRTACRAVR